MKCAKKYDYLEKYGTLVKAPYHLMPTFRFGYKNILVAKVKLKNGNSIELVKEKRLAENELNPSQEFVDVLIDLDNPNNYYIDFHIEEY